MHTGHTLHAHPHRINTLHTHTHAHYQHTQTQTHHTHTSKAYGSHTKHSYCHPANQDWDACAPLRRLSLVQANPSGAGIVTHRRSQEERPLNPRFHNGLNTAKRDKDSWVFASPVNSRYPLMLQLGGLLPQLTPGPH